MKKLFQNRYGLVRSGWVILICMVLFYALQYGLSNLIIELMRMVLTKTGDINAAAGYYSPLVDKIETEILPIAMQLLTEAVTIAIPLAAWKLMKYGWKDMGLRNFATRAKKDGVVGLLLGFGCCTLIFLVLLLTKNVQIDSVHFSFSPALFWWILIFLLVGFAEELFNRGLLMSVLRRSNNKYLVFAVPSVIFGGIHLMNPNVTLLSFFNIVLIGIAFSLMYYRSGNLWMCMGYHITWNLFQSIVYGMPVSGLVVPNIISSHYPVDNLLNGGGFGIEGGVLTTVVGILLIAFVLFYYKGSTYHFFPDPHVALQGPVGPDQALPEKS